MAGGASGRPGSRRWGSSEGAGGRGGCSDGPARTQVNTAAAEVLYGLIRDWAQLDAGSTVLDVCCGTGTIGLALAQVSPTNQPGAPPAPPPTLYQPLLHCPSRPRLGSHQSLLSPLQKVKRVVGVELSQEAVEDARVNALDNGEGAGWPGGPEPLPPMGQGQRRPHCRPTVHHTTWGRPAGKGFPEASWSWGSGIWWSGRPVEGVTGRLTRLPCPCRAEQRGVPLRQGRGAGAHPGEQAGLPAARGHSGPAPCRPA